MGESSERLASSVNGVNAGLERVGGLTTQHVAPALGLKTQFGMNNLSASVGSVSGLAAPQPMELKAASLNAPAGLAMGCGSHFSAGTGSLEVPSGVDTKTLLTLGNRENANNGSGLQVPKLASVGAGQGVLIGGKFYPPGTRVLSQSQTTPRQTQD